MKPLIYAAAAALGLASTGAVAAVVVVKSLGPSAKAYPPGKTLSASTKITLKGGDVVTILGPGSARTLRGPGSFDTTQVSLNSAAAQRGRFGALRTGDTARSPSLWDIDVTQSGKVCVADAKKVQLWRPDSEAAATVEIRTADGTPQQLKWAAGKALAAWPTAMPVSTGAQFEIAPANGADKSKLEVVTLAAVPKDPVALAQLLIEKGCENQLNMLVADALKASAAK
ncbi:MAG TPA: hypothetical protein VIL42_07620 [Sphingomicrobium sp.]|jgi:hypothetical protein